MIKIDDVTEEKWNSVNLINRKMVEEFLEQSTSLSIQTLKQYTSGLKIYFNWVKDNLENISFYELKGRDFLKFQNWLIKMEQSSSSIKFKRSCVSTFNNFVELYYLDKYPSFRNYVTKGIALPPSNFVNEKEPFTLEEYKNLCDVLAEKKMWQERAYIMFSFSSGARRSEVRQLLKEISKYEPKVINSGDEKKNVYATHKLRCKGKGKQGKIRQLNFDQSAMDAINKWLEVRGNDDCPFIFVTKSNGKYQQVGESTFNRWSTDQFEKILGRRFHPHLLRESRSTSMVVEQGKDISSVQKLLGHQSSVTSEIYVIRPDKDNADEAFV